MNYTIQKFEMFWIKLVDVRNALINTSPLSIIFGDFFFRGAEQNIIVLLSGESVKRNKISLYNSTREQAQDFNDYTKRQFSSHSIKLSQILY